VVGQLAAAVIAAIEGAVLLGGLSALGAGLFSFGIPKDSVVRYEKAIEADSFVVVGHGPVEEMTRAETLLKASNPSHFDRHQAVPFAAAV